MATIQSPGIVRDLMRLRGVEDGFHWKLIYQYQGLSGETLFALYSDPCHCDIYQSPYVRNPILLMEDGCLTDEGAAFLGTGTDKDAFNAQTEEMGLFDNDIGGTRTDAYDSEFGPGWGFFPDTLDLPESDE